MRIVVLISVGVVWAVSYILNSSSLAGGRIQGTANEMVAESQRERKETEPLPGTTFGNPPGLEQERKRLSEAAAGFGTDPTAIVGYYQVMYAHSTGTNNQRLDTVTATIRLPVTPNVGVQVNMPYTWAALGQTGGFTPNGTSDMTFRVGGRVYAIDKMALFLGADGSFPTASEPLLGTGKYTIGPGGAVAIPLPRIHSLFFLVIEDFNSIGGDPSRTNIHYTQFKPSINTIWGERWWTEVLLYAYSDWAHERKTTMNLQGEVGHRLSKPWALFVQGGGGVLGRDSFLGLDWFLQAGVRWVFKTPLLPASSSKWSTQTDKMPLLYHLYGP